MGIEDRDGPPARAVHDSWPAWRVLFITLAIIVLAWKSMDIAWALGSAHWTWERRGQALDEIEQRLDAIDAKLDTLLRRDGQP